MNDAVSLIHLLIFFAEKNGELIDYYSLQHKMASVICVLSSFMSQPIATSVYEFLQKAEADPTFVCSLNGDLPFRGEFCLFHSAI